MTDKTLQRDEFEMVDPLQIAASVIRVYMMSNYGNLVYLESVECKNPDDFHKTQFIGSLNVTMQKKVSDRFEIMKPLENAGKVVLNVAFQVISQTPRHTVAKSLREEYEKRGIKR